MRLDRDTAHPEQALQLGPRPALRAAAPALVHPSTQTLLQAGWALLASDPGVFKCHASPWDARYHSEAGSVAALLRAGHAVDSLQLRYQGVDWANPASWDCNGR